VLYSRQIVNQNSDKKPHFETMPNNAFEHSQKAIKAYEDTKQMPSGMSTGDLQPEGVAILYGMGALTAQRLQKH